MSGTTTTSRPDSSIADQASSRPKLVSRILGSRESGVLAALVVLIIVGSTFADGFTSLSNVSNVTQQVAQLGIMAVGMTFVILQGEIDLSIGSIYALGAVTCGMTITAGQPIILGILVGVAVGALAGLINGLATVKLGIPSFIVTLGGLSAYRGVALLLTDGAPISLPSGDPATAAFSAIARTRFLGVVPSQFLIMLAVFALGVLLLRGTTFGFHVYAVGGNREAARLCGINTGRVRIVAFIISGALAAGAGVLSLSFLSYVQGVTGTGLELSVISAVILGGCALFGGSGSMTGTLIGVTIMGVLQNTLVLLGLSSFWQTFSVGVLVVGAVALDTWLRSRRSPD